MANGINKVILIGNLGADPEIQTFDNDVKKATLRIATSESYRTRDGETVTHTEWHRVIMWRGLAGVAERFLRKGSKVYIEGRLRTRQYQDAQGVTKYTTEVEGRDLVMLDKKEDGAAPYQAPSQPTNTNPQPDPFTSPAPAASQPKAEVDDLPF